MRVIGHEGRRHLGINDQEVPDEAVVTTNAQYSKVFEMRHGGVFWPLMKVN